MVPEISLRYSRFVVAVGRCVVGLIRIISGINLVFKLIWLRLIVCVTQLIKEQFSIDRSSHQRCSIKKALLKSSQNSQESSCARVSEACNFIKKETLRNFAKFLRTPSLQNTSGRLLLTIVRGHHQHKSQTNFQ